MNHPLTCVLSLFALLGSALPARAVAIRLESTGQYVVDPAIFAHDTEAVSSQTGGYGALNALTTTFNVQGGQAYAGSGTYTGLDGTLRFSLEYTSYQYNGDQTGTYSGTWTATGGTGTYRNATGGGTLSTLADFAAPPPYTFSKTVFAGDVQASPVPEPGALFGLGLGATILLRRRR